MKKQFYYVEFDDEKSSKTFKTKFLSGYYDLIATILSSIISIALILVFLLRVATVEGTSMNPTLEDKDMLIITNLTFGYKRGDIVVIYREDDVALIKRVIAVAGDKINIDFENGIVEVNDKVLSEDYILEPTYRSFPEGPEFPLTVPEGYVFVMGDNRNNSLDSRSPKVGLINTQYIMGKMVIDFNNTGAK